MIQPALLGGVAMGVLSALPVINIANCCCAWILFGGGLAAYLMQQGVKIDASTQRQSAGQINGMEAASLAFSGKDEDEEDIEISVSVFVVNPSAAVVLTYWGSKEGEQTYAAELRSILQSLQRK